MSTAARLERIDEKIGTENHKLEILERARFTGFGRVLNPLFAIERSRTRGGIKSLQRERKTTERVGAFIDRSEAASAAFEQRQWERLERLMREHKAKKRGDKPEAATIIGRSAPEVSAVHTASTEPETVEQGQGQPTTPIDSDTTAFIARILLDQAATTPDTPPQDEL